MCVLEDGELQSLCNACGVGKLCEPYDGKFSVGCSLIWENRPVQVIQSWGL